jgi:hypothetical protein
VLLDLSDMAAGLFSSDTPGGETNENKRESGGFSVSSVSFTACRADLHPPRQRTNRLQSTSGGRGEAGGM